MNSDHTEPQQPHDQSSATIHPFNTHSGSFDPSTWKSPVPDSPHPSVPKEAKGGRPPTNVTNEQFITALFRDVPPTAAPLVCSQQGDPQNALGWLPRAATAVATACPPANNNYFNCSSCHQTEGNRLTAKTDAFAAYHALVLDDVGTKVDAGKLGRVEPSWTIETSPGNHQLGFIIDPPITDVAQLQDLQDRVITAGLCDPGALGRSRWMRLPNGINGKAKYRDAEGRPFQCKLLEWRPDRRFSLSELIGELRLPKAQTKEHRSVGTSHAYRDDEVCTFPSAQHPVVTELRKRGYYKKQIKPGHHDITCPWSIEHTDELDTGACYYEPSEEYPRGGFKCHHAHGDRLHVADLMGFLGMSPTDAENKPTVRVIQGALHRILRAAEKVLDSRGDIYQFGGAIVALREDGATGEVRIEPFTEQWLRCELSRLSTWLQPVGDGKWKVVDPPQTYVTSLFKAGRYAVLRELKGTARQPYFDANGKLVLSPGYNPETGIYAAFDPSKFVDLDFSPSGAEAALAELDALLDEFPFSAGHDRSAALSAILTAVLRPSLALAPAYSITATSPGSGKSYLADLKGAFATPGYPIKASYPATSEEATKALLSHLIPQPPVLIFDDMTTDWKAFGAINRILTSERVADRLLTTNRVQEVSTRTLIIGTGNNIAPQNDLRRRVLSIRLHPMTANPALQSYSGRPVEKVRSNREHYVKLVLQIVCAWKEAGSPKTAEFPLASYGEWSELCREPLLWLGLPDPATGFRHQLQNDPDAELLREFLQAWHDKRADRPTMVRELISLCDGYEDNSLQTALEELPIYDGNKLSRSKLGWYIKKQCGRIAGDFMIEPAPHSERRAWRVVKIEHSPPLPPSKEEKEDSAAPASVQPGEDWSATSSPQNDQQPTQR